MDKFDRLIENYADGALKINGENRACHIAFLLKTNKIALKIGYNRMDRQCFRGREITSLHAEIDCLRQYRPIRDLTKKGYNLLVVNISKDICGKIKYKDSRPCIHCTKFLRGLGFTYVYCSTPEGIIEKMSLIGYDPYKTSAQIRLDQNR